MCDTCSGSGPRGGRRCRHHGINGSNRQGLAFRAGDTAAPETHQQERSNNMVGEALLGGFVVGFNFTYLCWVRLSVGVVVWGIVCCVSPPSLSAFSLLAILTVSVALPVWHLKFRTVLQYIKRTKGGNLTF